MRAPRFTFTTTRQQFYLLDSETRPDPVAIWTPESRLRRLAPGHGYLAVGTVDPFTHVAVTVHVFEREPGGPGPGLWAYVGEEGLVVSSGTLRLVPCGDGPGQAFVVPLAPGDYRVRVSCDRGERAPVVPGGTETYRIDVWPQGAPASGLPS